METDREFISVFNEYYPFERYIFKNAQPINYLFDDAILTEIFIPHFESKDDSIPVDEIFVKIKSLSDETRFSYFDFAEHIREQIVYNFIEDFGQYNYESLYVDHEDGCNELKSALRTEKALIIQKYGECNIKSSVRDNLV